MSDSPQSTKNQLGICGCDAAATDVGSPQKLSGRPRCGECVGHTRFAANTSGRRWRDGLADGVLGAWWSIGPFDQKQPETWEQAPVVSLLFRICKTQHKENTCIIPLRESFRMHPDILGMVSKVSYAPHPSSSTSLTGSPH